MRIRPLPTNRPPTTVGDILSRSYLKPLGLTQGQFAYAIGVDRPAINEIVNGKRRITVEMAHRFAKALQSTPDFWLSVQFATDMYEAKQNGVEAKVAKIKEIQPRELRSA